MLQTHHYLNIWHYWRNSKNTSTDFTCTQVTFHSTVTTNAVQLFVLQFVAIADQVLSNCPPHTLPYEDVAGSHVWISRGFYRTTLQTVVGCSVCKWLMCHFVYMWQCWWPLFPFNTSLSVRALLQPLATNTKKKPRNKTHTEFTHEVEKHLSCNLQNWLKDRCFSTNQTKTANTCLKKIRGRKYCWLFW